MDYMSFDEVMRELNLEEDDLKRMVSEGQIRAFRSENKMKFRKSDIENLRHGKMSEPTVILPAEPSATDQVPAQPPALDLDIDSEVMGLTESPAAPPERPVELEPVPEQEPVAEASAPETIDLEPVLEAADESADATDLHPDDLMVAEETTQEAEEPELVEEEVEETFVEEETETGAETAPLAMAEEEAPSEETTEVAEEEEAAAPEPRRRPRRAAALAAAAPAAKPSVGIFTFLVLVLVVATSAVAIFVGVGMMGLGNDVADGIAQWRGETIWQNSEFQSAVKSRLPQQAPARDPITGQWVPYTANATRPTFRLPAHEPLNPAGAGTGAATGP